MLERHDVIRGSWDEESFFNDVTSDLPGILCDRDRLEAKLRRDQEKLLALVRLIRHDGERMAFIRTYFDQPSTMRNFKTDASGWMAEPGPREARSNH